jgi:O-antigen/teichoic acid export membrane protein
MNEGSSRKGRSRDILANVLTSYVREVVEILSFLVLIPFLIRTLGTETFGLWSLIWSFVSLFSLIDMGIGSSVVKYVADAKGRDDLERQQQVISTIFWIYMGLGVLLLGGVAASLLFFNEAFDIPEAQRASARMVLLILGVRSAFSIPLDLFRGILVGYQRSRVANAYRTLATVAYFIAVLLVLPHVPTLWMLAALNLLMGVVPRLAMLIHARTTLPGVTLHPRYFNRKTVGEVTSFSVYFMIIQVSALIYTRVDALIIKAYLPLEMVAVYSIAMRLSDTAERFCTQLDRVLTPVVAELKGAEDTANIRAVWFRGTKLTVAMAAPLVTGLAMLAEPLIRAWTGPEFALAAPTLYWLLAATMIGIIHGNTHNLLSMGGDQRYQAFSVLAGQGLNILLSILLIRPFGIVGVSMATLLSILPSDVGLIQTRAGRRYGCSHWAFYRRTVLPSVPSAVLIAAFLYGVQRWWKLDTLVEVGLAEAAGVALFGLSFWWIGFDGKERAYFKEKVWKRVGRSRGAEEQGSRGERIP